MSAMQDLYFPQVLKRSVSLLLTAVLPSLAALAALAFVSWLVWGEADGAERNKLVLLCATSTLPALAAAGVMVFRRSSLPGGAQLLVAGCALCHGALFLTVASDAVPSSTPDWAVGGAFFTWQSSAMMIPIFIGIWRVAAHRFENGFKDGFVGAIAVGVVAPGLFALLVYVAVEFFWRLIPDWLNAAFVVVPIFFAAALLLVVGMMRIVLLLHRFFRQRGERGKWRRAGFTAVVALALPIGGLILNIWIPFPAWFQSPWAYGLTVLNAAFLIAPESGRRGFDAAMRFGRLAAFSFTFYFFLVFLPFLPLAGAALIVYGAGILVLAPTLLFILHLERLDEDFAAWRRNVPLAVFAALALPLGFLGATEYERSAVRDLTGQNLAQSFDTPEHRTRIGSIRAHAALAGVRKFKDGAFVPYLSDYRNWRVFDNLILRDDTFNSLWRVYVGGEPPQPDISKMGVYNEIYSELWGRRASSGWQQRGGAADNTRFVDLTGAETAEIITENGETRARVLLSVSANENARKSRNSEFEYRGKIEAPEGVFIDGFKLLIGDEWVDARLFERRAAEWVYRQIRTARIARDPAILRYEADGSVSLRIYPVGRNETRQVEISFLAPAGYASSVAVDGEFVSISDSPNEKFAVSANGVTACSNIKIDRLSNIEFAVVDCSEKTGVTKEDLNLHAGNPGDFIACANYEMTAWEPLRDRMDFRPLPKRGGLDIDMALRRATRAIADASGGTNFNYTLRFISKGGTNIFSSARPETWVAMRRELSGACFLGVETPFEDSIFYDTFDIPDAFENISDFCETTIALEEFSRKWGERGVEIREMPADSSWAQAAEAWRLWLEMERHPDRADALRMSALKAAKERNVLTPVASFVVMENTLQWKMLEVKEKELAKGKGAFDSVNTIVPEPASGMLALLGAALLFGRRRRG